MIREDVKIVSFIYIFAKKFLVHLLLYKNYWIIMITRSILYRTLAGKHHKVQPVAPVEDLGNLENYWERAMSWYNTYNTQLSLKGYRTIAPFLNLQKAKKVLEIGGGTGSGAEILIPELNSSATYTLTDHIECFLKVARAKNLKNTEVINVNPSKLPFAGESFDRFVAMATIEELETTKVVLREAYRVLQPGGIIGASMTGKRENDNYRVISERVRQKFGITSPLKFRSDLKNLGMIKKMFSGAGFAKTFTFYENIQFSSPDIQELKTFFMQEPTIAEQSKDILKQIDEYLEHQLTDLLKVEEIPLGTDFLMIVGFKN